MSVNYFDERVAASYDDEDGNFDPEDIVPVIDFLVDLVGEGRALEFGVGTGRIALPLAARGVPVSGIDLSGPMLARLAEKPGGSKIDVRVGDIATTTVTGSFSLVYLIFNTIMNLNTQAGQVDSFRNAAAHLEPGGAFIIEVMTPRLQKLPQGDSFVAWDVSEDHWGIDEYDVANQTLISHHARVVSNNVERSSIPFRYVWPAELDLMARLAGLELKERWNDWDRSPFTSTSEQHVSVWIKPEA